MADAKHTTNGHRLYNVTCLSRPPAASYPWRVSAALLTDHESMEAADREADRHRAAVVESSPEVAALRARVAELEAERAQKPRDESVPPPGWAMSPERFDDETEPYCWRVSGAVETPLSQAWVLYDREHGYAPDEARIRADERAKCQAEVERLRAALDAVRDDAYVLGEDCREHNGPIGACDECPHCDLARRIDAALATAAPPCTHPKDRRIATLGGPGSFDCLVCGFSVSTMSPAEPAAPDPWALPEPLTWGHDRDGWYIVDGDGDALRLQPVRAIRGSLTRRDDAARLIDLLCRRHADEPKGPT